MQFQCLTYTSLAALDLQDDDVRSIRMSAQALNGIDGISGILIFNGSHFLQVVEGPPAAIADLMERLRGDRRHSSIEVRDERMIDQRLFGDWSMNVFWISSDYQLAQDELSRQLPSGLPDHVRDRIITMVERISEDIQP